MLSQTFLGACVVTSKQRHLLAFSSSTHWYIQDVTSGGRNSCLIITQLVLICSRGEWSGVKGCGLLKKYNAAHGQGIELKILLWSRVQYPYYWVVRFYTSHRLLKTPRRKKISTIPIPKAPLSTPVTRKTTKHLSITTTAVVFTNNNNTTLQYNIGKLMALGTIQLTFF